MCFSNLHNTSRMLILLVSIIWVLPVDAEPAAEKPGWQADRKQVEAWKMKRRPEFNYEESSVPEYQLPDPLKTIDGKPIKYVCQSYDLSRSQYYEKEDQFIEHGILGLFPKFKTLPYVSELERLIVMVSKARPSLSQQAMLRIAQALPSIRDKVDIEVVSHILASYGRGTCDQPMDRKFWFRIQRTLNQLSQICKRPLRGRNKKQRKKPFSKMMIFAISA